MCSCRHSLNVDVEVGDHDVAVVEVILIIVVTVNAEGAKKGTIFFVLDGAAVVF
jgi:hypothetical protein